MSTSAVPATLAQAPARTVRNMVAAVRDHAAGMQQAQDEYFAGLKRLEAVYFAKVKRITDAILQQATEATAPAASDPAA